MNERDDDPRRTEARPEMQADAEDRWLSRMREDYAPVPLDEAGRRAFDRRLAARLESTPRLRWRTAWVSGLAAAVAASLALWIGLPGAETPEIRGAAIAPATSGSDPAPPGAVAWEYEVLFPLEIAPWEDRFAEDLPAPWQALARALDEAPAAGS